MNNESTTNNYKSIEGTLRYGNQGILLPLHYELGLNLIPSNGKIPILKGWDQFSKRRVSDEEFQKLQSAHPYANVSLVTGEISKVIVIDVDTDDPRIHRLFEGYPLKRKGKPGRCSYLAKYNGELSKEWLGEDIELLTTGQQCVLFGLHPTAKIEYIVETLNGISLLEAFKILPVLSTEIREKIKKIAPKVNSVKSSPKKQEKGDRNNQLSKTAWRLANNVLSKQETYESAIDELKSHPCSYWFSDPEEPHGGKDPEGSVKQMLDKSIAKIQELNKIALSDLIQMSTVERKEVEWVFRKVIPNQMCTMFSGDPGTGKSYLSLFIAAFLSKKGISSIFFSTEDSPEHVIKARLDTLGANQSLIYIYKKKISLNDTGINIMREFIITKKPGAFFIDPITAVLTDGTDMHRANEVRKNLAELCELAYSHNCAGIMIRHNNKGAEGVKAIHRGQGSIDFTGAVRSEIAILFDPDDRNRRIVGHIKCNVGPLDEPFTYVINDKEGVVVDYFPKDVARLKQIIDGEKIKIEKSDALEKLNTQEVEAKNVIIRTLMDGPIRSEKLYSAAKAFGVSSKQLNNVIRQSGLVDRVRDSEAGKSRGAGGWLSVLVPEKISVLDGIDDELTDLKDELIERAKKDNWPKSKSKKNCNLKANVQDGNNSEEIG